VKLVDLDDVNSLLGSIPSQMSWIHIAMHFVCSVLEKAGRRCGRQNDIQKCDALVTKVRLETTLSLDRRNIEIRTCNHRVAGSSLTRSCCNPDQVVNTSQKVCKNSILQLKKSIYNCRVCVELNAKAVLTLFVGRGNCTVCTRFSTAPQYMGPLTVLPVCQVDAHSAIYCYQSFCVNHRQPIFSSCRRQYLECTA